MGFLREMVRLVNPDRRQEFELLTNVGAYAPFRDHWQDDSR
jgi:hypothetical protein